MTYSFSKEFAAKLDAADELKDFRKRFEFPQNKGNNVIYFTGNSLGLLPDAARKEVNNEMNKWSAYGVDGHFYADDPWYNYHKYTKKGNAMLVGAKEDEVVVMNTLSVNLHLLLVSFYTPTKQRFKIICEEKAFPSDQYILETQANFHGFDPKEAIVEVPVDEDGLITTETFKKVIDENADEACLFLVGGINYYSGQRYDMKELTAYAQSKGLTVGFDLAHAAGNIELELHDWGVDFAAWCTYKYMNSGPGSPSGIFIHQKHFENKTLHRFAGWWGYDEDTRFKMEPGFVPTKGADGWQLSNGAVIAHAAHRGALEMFEEVGTKKLFAKRDALTGYLEFILDEVKSKANADFRILTPRDKTNRGSQLSILVPTNGRKLFDYLSENGVIPDWREPNVIRLAPVPMYNSFSDMYNFGLLLEAFYKN